MLAAPLSSATANATGFNALAVAYAKGGVGGASAAGTISGTGGAATLTNAVSGATLGGTLNLTQQAIGGDGGTKAYTSGIVGGVGGSAGSALTFSDKANTHSAANLTGLEPGQWR